MFLGVYMCLWFPCVLVLCWDQVTSWPVLLADGNCLFSLYLFPLSALGGVHSEYIYQWVGLEGPCNPWDREASHSEWSYQYDPRHSCCCSNSSQCLLSIYCVPCALHRRGLEVNSGHWGFRDSFHLGGPNNSSPEYPECRG